MIQRTQEKAKIVKEYLGKRRKKKGKMLEDKNRVQRSQMEAKKVFNKM